MIAMILTFTVLAGFISLLIALSFPWKKRVKVPLE